jgi:hypothetical protein
MNSAGFRQRVESRVFRANALFEELTAKVPVGK